MAPTTVTVKSGEWRGSKIENETFELVRGYTVGTRGGFVTVRGTHGNRRIRVENQSHIVVHETPHETDESILRRIQERFAILDDMTAAAIRGDIRAMIVSGPPGVGKSFGVERQLDKYSLFEVVSDMPPQHEIIKGSVSAIGLYATLYRHSDPGHVVVFDDCDSVLFDADALNLLKGALDSGGRRRITWNSDSHFLRRSGIPEAFEFKGAVIFITNLDLTQNRSKKIGDHLTALRSRCHYLDLTMHTERDKILRLRQIFESGSLFKDYSFSEDTGREIIEFVIDNRSQLNELSIRMCLKIADLTRVSSDWQSLARATCMRATPHP